MEPIEYLNGFLLLIQISTFLIILIIMGSHYRKTRQRVFILIPLSFIGLFIAWLPHFITFLLFLSAGQSLTLQQHFFIALIYVPIALLLWIIAITEFILKNYRKLVIIIYIVTGVLFEIAFLYFLFTELSVIGQRVSLLDIEYHGFARIYLLFVIISISITNLLFISQSFKSEDRELRLKGKFLLVSLIFYIIGSIADSALSLTIPLLLIIVRLCLVGAAITFYIGWFLPKPIKKLFKIS